jgi:hypothetical protein
MFNFPAHFFSTNFSSETAVLRKRAQNLPVGRDQRHTQILRQGDVFTIIAVHPDRAASFQNPSDETWYSRPPMISSANCKTAWPHPASSRTAAHISPGMPKFRPPQQRRGPNRIRRANRLRQFCVPRWMARQAIRLASATITALANQPVDLGAVALNFMVSRAARVRASRAAHPPAGCARWIPAPQSLPCSNCARGWPPAFSRPDAPAFDSPLIVIVIMAQP